MEFTWDDRKNESNKKKHKVSFEEAMTVFYDDQAKIADDPDHSLDEQRFILLGHSQNKRLLFVVHIYQESDEVIRIISARKATKKETKQFQEE